MEPVPVAEPGPLTSDALHRIFTRAFSLETEKSAKCRRIAHFAGTDSLRTSAVTQQISCLGIASIVPYISQHLSMSNPST